VPRNNTLDNEAKLIFRETGEYGNSAENLCWIDRCVRHPRILSDVPNPQTLIAGKMSPARGAPRLRVYGFGAGPRAVGSIHIDRLGFGPGDIRPAQHEAAAYSFHAGADFKKAAAEFLRVGLANGEIMTERANQDLMEDGIRRDASKSGNWNGEDRAKKISEGQHLLQVRAWESRDTNGDGGDWVAAWSDNAVRVE
jgi:hypothetical protein